MSQTVLSDIPRWFILNHIPESTAKKASASYAVDSFNRAGGSLELFAPTIVELRKNGSKTTLVEKPLTYHYIFVRGREKDLKRLCTTATGFSFLLSHSEKERYATLTDIEMEKFKTVARAYSNRLPFYSLENVSLEEGDEVEIVDGEFAGLVGIYMPKPRSNSGNLIIAVNMSFATAVFDVKAKNIRILRFANNSKRAYDYAEKIMPELLQAMRKFTKDERLSPTEITNLTIFCDRMRYARPENRKFGAKLASLLACANLILGRQEEFHEAQSMLEKFIASVTNPWTKAQILLLEAVPARDIAKLHYGYALISEAGSQESKAKATLRAEYEHYLLSPGFQMKSENDV